MRPEPQSDDQLPPEPPPLPPVSLGEFFRMVRAGLRRNSDSQLRQLSQEARKNPGGLATWALAFHSWRQGHIAAAYQAAQKVLPSQPTDFWMLLICLDYHVRARNSTQIYAFAEKLIATKNPANQLRCMYAVLAPLLWPLWLLGLKHGRRLRSRADNFDRWVLWAKNYIASRPKQSVANGDRR